MPNDPADSLPPTNGNRQPNQASAFPHGSPERSNVHPSEGTAVSDGPPPSADSVNLDLLRSTAALFVVLFHVLLFFGVLNRLPQLHSIGHWGVLMFFVHTSLVLMLSLERQRYRSHGGSLFTEFMLRRCFRLLPLSMLVVVLVVGLDLPVAHLQDGSFVRVELGLGGVLSNLLLVQNLTHTDSVMATLWSLPYEMQMYLTLPALFFFAKNSRTSRPLFALWIACALLALAWARAGRADLFDFPQYVPCFLAGVVAFRLAPVTRRSFPPLLWPVALVALTIVYLLWPTRPGGAVSCLVLGVLIPRFRELEGKHARRALQLFARYSYGLYLTHFICLWLAFDAMRTYDAWLRWGVFFITVVGLPVVLYHSVEAPMIAVGVRVVQRLRARPAAAAIAG
jgi:peptidoglycan/LPS O-acetylase OafA/YrhL